jgi:uncharacterized membrane protein
LIIAIIIALTGTIILNIGFALQKSEVKNLPVISLRELKSTVKAFLACKRWLLGSGLTSLGWLFFLIAISLAPLTVIAPLGNVGVLVLVFLAIVYFKEKLLGYEYIAFILVLVGVLIITLNSTTPVNITNYDSMQLFFLVILISSSVGLLGIIQFSWFPKNRGTFLGLTSGITGGFGAVFTKTMTLSFQAPIELILFFVLFVLSQGLSFVSLQSAFQRERALIVVPLFNSFSTIVPIIIGLFVFHEIISPLQFVGILIIIIGSSTLFRFNMQQESSLDEIN